MLKYRLGQLLKCLLQMSSYLDYNIILIIQSILFLFYAMTFLLDHFKGRLLRENVASNFRRSDYKKILSEIDEENKIGVSFLHYVQIVR